MGEKSANLVTLVMMSTFVVVNCVQKSRNDETTDRWLCLNHAINHLQTLSICSHRKPWMALEPVWPGASPTTSGANPTTYEFTAL
jgi:hypothetical protein